EASGEHAALAPALPTHLLIAPEDSGCLLGLGCHLRDAAYTQQPEGCDCDSQPQPGGPLRVFHPCMLPLPTTTLAVLEPLLDPASQAVPGWISLRRRQLTQNHPRLLVTDAPPTEQCPLQLPPRRRKRRTRAAPALPFLQHH